MFILFALSATFYLYSSALCMETAQSLQQESTIVECARQSKNKISFWDKPQHGANIFNHHIVQKDIKVAKDCGITFIRLAPDKFPTQERDFLIGNADNYINLSSEDLIHLKKILDMCAHENMPVVLTMLSLPGSRWKQNNNGEDDLRLWCDFQYQEQAAQFWQDLATALNDHPALVGYNLLNEPHLERIYDTNENHLSNVNQEEVQKKLFDFYHHVLNAIRTVDKTTPLILDSSAYSDPKTFCKLKTHSDDCILYSFHMYEPFEYTNNKINKGTLRYPGHIHNSYWDKQILKNYLKEIEIFQKTNAIDHNRILVGEFGGHRTSQGLAQYLNDLLDIFKENRWHCAFYAFREDTWDGMDYELGNSPLSSDYWQQLEKGLNPTLERDADNPLFKIIKDIYSSFNKVEHN